MPLSNAAKNAIMNSLVGREYNVLGGTMYLGLSSSLPDATGAGITEPDAASGYERVLIGTYGSSATYKMGAAVDGVSKNTTAILFPRAKTNWGTMNYAVFFTAASGGTFIGWAPLSEGRAVNADYVANFDKEAIQLSITDAA